MASRSKIGDVDKVSNLPVRAKSFSLRAAKLKLTVRREKCPHCHHHKVIENMTFKKCARCKVRIE